MRELDDGRRSTQGTFLCESRGKNNPEQGTCSICPGEVQLPAVLLNHLPGYRQTKSGTTILAIGHKGLEKGITNGLGDARGVVPNANLNSAVPPMEVSSTRPVSGDTASQACRRLHERHHSQGMRPSNVGDQELSAGPAALSKVRHAKNNIAASAQMQF